MREANRTDRPLCKCHGEPMGKNGPNWACAVKRRARAARWDREHRDQLRAPVRERVKRWRKANPAKLAAQQARKNDRRRGKPQPASHAESVRRWQERNPERWRLICRVKQQARDARKVKAAGTTTAEQLLARFAFYGNRCVYCGTDEQLTIDHVKPLARGGSHWPANLRPACLSCNSRKGAKEVMPS